MVLASIGARVSLLSCLMPRKEIWHEISTRRRGILGRTTHNIFNKISNNIWIKFRL